MKKLKYQISSRATILLGRESVAKVDGALIELVKNTYDADADFCYLCFDIENDCIYIFDNGIGMTENIIEQHWMLIGTDNKKVSYQSERNRVKSGEKGIGRFALDRLGSKCEMLTKHNSSENVIRWSTDWSNFEETGKKLDEVEAELDFLSSDFQSIIPDFIVNDMPLLRGELSNELHIEHGTLLKITNLRDPWDEKDIDRIIYSLGYVLPPTEQDDYVICIRKNRNSQCNLIMNIIPEEYDYKLDVTFDGDLFHIKLLRNEFDVNKIPKAVFEMDFFQQHPFRYEDFEAKEFNFTSTISELMKNTDPKYIGNVQKVGKFKFKYTFMKLSLQEESQGTYFYKEISKNRAEWLKNYGGVKIYRDNFLVRPYGDPNSDAFDWLGLDARRAKSPAAISHPGGGWRVRNRQGQGTVLISRITNEHILDKSSREGIIENEYFYIFKQIITNIISFFEQDRAKIGYAFKVYEDNNKSKEQKKKEGSRLAHKVLRQKATSAKTSRKQAKALAETIEYYEEEKQELITEIKLLRSLATNGLITTAIAHDLKSVGAMLNTRVKTLKSAIDIGDQELINRHLSDIDINDSYLSSWILIMNTQVKRDKRTRTKWNLYEVIQNSVMLMKPILSRKLVKVTLHNDEKETTKRIFVSDFESIIYNLIINSIDAFEKTDIKREINIFLETKDGKFIIRYLDNGCGLDKKFSDPYDIFLFGTTSKHDKNGEIIGTGLGMYIIASTAREYEAKYAITEFISGFGFDIEFPL